MYATKKQCMCASLKQTFFNTIKMFYVLAVIKKYFGDMDYISFIVIITFTDILCQCNVKFL